MKARNVRRLLRLSCVQRWGTVPTVQRQSVAEHTLNVQALTLWLLDLMTTADRLADRDRFYALNQALRHDAEEACVGDIPAPAKATADRLDGDDVRACLRRLVRVADVLEACLFLRAERDLGNTALNAIYDNRLKALQTAWTGFIDGCEAHHQRQDRNSLPRTFAWTFVVDWAGGRTAGMLLGKAYNEFHLARHPIMEWLDEADDARPSLRRAA